MVELPLSNLTEEIAAAENISDGYDYVVTHLARPERREHYRKPEVKARITAQLREELGRGTFRITRADTRDIRVYCGKERICQSPTVVKRIGCHCVMSVLERHLYGMLIKNTASSIKGRGMHWLHHIIEEDIRAVPEKFRYFYKSDIRKFYDSIDHGVMKGSIRRYVSDATLLPVLDSFVDVLETGLSKGLQSSQTFSTLLLAPVHRRMQEEVSSYETEAGEVRYLYYNYCDDTVMAGPDKRELWRLRDIYVGELAKLGLEVKGDEAVRPIETGLDMVGYVHYPTHTRLRKGTKQRAARKLARVKSRKRRQEIIGSFKGMAKHGDCKHLYNVLTGRDMKKFSEMGIRYQPADGKKRFAGKVMRLSAIQNIEIEVHDYESDVTTSHGDGRYLVSFRVVKTGEWGKFFTSSEEMKNILDQISDIEDGFPFETEIRSEVFDGNKVRYGFS